MMNSFSFSFSCPSPSCGPSLLEQPRGAIWTVKNESVRCSHTYLHLMRLTRITMNYVYGVLHVSGDPTSHQTTSSSSRQQLHQYFHFQWASSAILSQSDCLLECEFLEVREEKKFLLVDPVLPFEACEQLFELFFSIPDDVAELDERSAPLLPLTVNLLAKSNDTLLLFAPLQMIVKPSESTCDACVPSSFSYITPTSTALSSFLKASSLSSIPLWASNAKMCLIKPSAVVFRSFAIVDICIPLSIRFLLAILPASSRRARWRQSSAAIDFTDQLWIERCIW